MEFASNRRIGDLNYAQKKEAYTWVNDRPGSCMFARGATGRLDSAAIAHTTAVAVATLGDSTRICVRNTDLGKGLVTIPTAHVPRCTPQGHRLNT